jgi:peptidoglycan/xylan/chitin deacetylase (PgdA/CDA1 family)
VQRIALSFDDGPDPEWTRRLLDVLGEREVRATFFVWGEQAVRHPEVVRATLAGGHDVQPHCFEHVRHWELTPAAISADIDRVIGILAELGAGPPLLWRPPYGKVLSGATREIARERGLQLAGWTIDTNDWSGIPAAQMETALRDQLPADGVAVPIMHDGTQETIARTYRTDASQTIELVRRLTADPDLAFAALTRGLDEGLEERPAP